MTGFEKYLVPGKKGYLIGIGGVSMSPLAEVLKGMGLDICGTDMSKSEKTELLCSKGIKVNIGHNADNIDKSIDFVVRTAAVHDRARGPGRRKVIADGPAESACVEEKNIGENMAARAE